MYIFSIKYLKNKLKLTAYPRKRIKENKVKKKVCKEDE